MSNDIATISLRVNTTELERGNQALDRFQETATAAAGKADEPAISVKRLLAVSPLPVTPLRLQIHVGLKR